MIPLGNNVLVINERGSKATRSDDIEKSTLVWHLALQCTAETGDRNQIATKNKSN